MTDYTPTTEEVRSDYCLLADVSRPRQLQFDRWLEEHDRQIAEKAYEEGAFRSEPCKCRDCIGLLHNPYRKGGK